MKYAKVSGDNVVIKLPIDVLQVAFDNNPFLQDEGIRVKFNRKFAEAFADKINKTSTNSESGLTAFQELIDVIFEEMVSDDSPYIIYPEE